MAAGDVIVIRENAFGRKGNYFDGTDDYVLHDAHAVARVAANDTVGTYSAWIYCNSVSGNMAILSAGDNNADEYLLLTTAGTQLKVELYQGGATQFRITQTTGTLEARKWMHVAVVQNGIQPALYINGVNVAATNAVATDLTMWYDELTGCDKFAVGVLERNGTHTSDFTGAIGQVKYWSVALTAPEIMAYYKYENGNYNSTQLTTAVGSTRETALDAALQFNITMEDDGVTDSGLGADDGTLTGNAHYGGYISNWSRAIERNSSGHAAEFINTFRDGDEMVSVIKRGD